MFAKSMRKTACLTHFYILFKTLIFSHCQLHHRTSPSPPPPISVSRRAMPGSELHCVRGCGVVNASPADILALLTAPERRRWYDDMCTEVRAWSDASPITAHWPWRKLCKNHDCIFQHSHNRLFRVENQRCCFLCLKNNVIIFVSTPYFPCPLFSASDHRA